MSLILGLVGTPGAGKSAVTDYIMKTYGGSQYRFSDYLSHVLQKMNIEKSRENMIKLSVILRKEFGEDLLSHAVASDAVRSTGELTLVDGIRRPEDLAAFRPLPNFKLIAINADAKIRYERMKHRGEKVGETNMTWEEFEATEKASTEVTIPEAMTFADFVIMNDGTLEEVHAKIDDIMKELGIPKSIS
jgi:dephospho-CoA kinase